MLRSSNTQDNRGRLVLAVPESDCHVIAIRLLEWFLRDEGFDVQNLGVCTSDLEIAEAVACFDPLAVVIASQNGHALKDLRGLRDHFSVFAVSPDLPVYIGGNLSVDSRDSGAELVVAEFARIGLTVVGTFEELRDRLTTLAANVDPESTASTLEIGQTCFPDLAIAAAAGDRF